LDGKLEFFVLFDKFTFGFCDFKVAFLASELQMETSVKKGRKNSKVGKKAKICCSQFCENQ